MFKLDLGKDDIKSLMSPVGAFQVIADVDHRNKPFPKSDGKLVSLAFDTGPTKELKLGGSGSAVLSLEAETNAQLLLVWPGTAARHAEALQALGLENYFSGNAHGDQLLTLLTIGADLDAAAAAGFKYQALTAEASIGAGVDGSYRMARAFPADTPADKLLLDFFKGLRMPAGVTAAPAEGEAVRFEFGGYLKFGADIGLGYTITGSPSQQISGLTLSENYSLSLLGELGFQSKLAGRFSVQVSHGSTPGWAHVKVTKSKNKSFRVAADLHVGAELDVKGLPGDSNEFLEALLGLKAKNWINLFEKAKQYTSFEELEEKLDDLAKDFITEWTGKAFRELKNTEWLTTVLDNFNKILDSYQNVGDTAVSLFDRYYDPATEKINDALTKALEEITAFTSPDQLKGTALGDELSKVIYELTDGRPMDWLLSKIEIDGKEVPSLEELKKRAEKVLSLIKDMAHKKIREFIATAKSQFPLDDLISGLKNIDLDQLNTEADKKLIAFAARFVGKTVKEISGSKLGKTVTTVNKALENVDEFKNNLYAKVQKAMTQSLQLNLGLAYNRESENTALVDVELNLLTEAGKQLMKAAGNGDFSKLLCDYDPAVVRINNGVLTHTVTRKSSVSFNVVGWHKDFKYQDIRRLVSKSEQHIAGDADGMVTVTTDISLDISRDKSKNDNRIYTNMILGFVGASTGAAVYDAQTQRYLVDSITRFAADYRLVLEDQNTTPAQLDEYLKYAVDFGITETKEEADQALVQLMAKDEHGNFGSVSLDYQVRFSETGLKALAESPPDEQTLRKLIRELTLVNYLNSGKRFLIKRGWCYWTPWIYDVWEQHPADFPEAAERFLPFRRIAPSPIKAVSAPKQVTLDFSQLFFLNRLYIIENCMVKGFSDLRDVLQNKRGITPLEYQERLGKLGKALDDYDHVDAGVNTFFGIFDALIETSGLPAVRDSGLTLKSKLPGQEEEMTKMLIA